jgi:hypothetical protein
MDKQLGNYQYLYLHGFASSPQSRKAVYFAQQYQQLGIKLNIIDFNQPDFANLTLTRQINQVCQLLEKNLAHNYVLIGSSFGGLTANWVAHRFPECIQALILLAPALNFLDYWRQKIAPETLFQWQQQGSLAIYHYGAKKELPLNYLFWQDLQTYDDAQINLSIPTLIFHGVHDEVISIEVSRTYAQHNPHVTLRELDSDHSLNDCHAPIYQQINDWLELIIYGNNTNKGFQEN